jgi:pyrimidine operon attenuation protein/uracil phosphoribosyltransferase
LAGGLDALYLTPSGPHQMALFTSELPLGKPPAGPAPAALDAFYVTRLQRERLPDKSAAPDRYVHFNASALKTSRTQGAVVMHPLPRTDELAYELDTDPRAAYFEQAAAGVPVRMALISWLLERRHAPRAANTAPASASPITIVAALRCANSNCITRHEGSYLSSRFTLAGGYDASGLPLRCVYCERDLLIEYVGHVRTRRYYRFDENLRGYVRQWMEEGSLAVFESVKEAEEAGYEPYRRGPQRELMNADEIARAISALADQIVADAPEITNLVIAGIIGHGAITALRLREIISARAGVRVPCITVDIYNSTNLIRDGENIEEVDINDRTIVLVDDVINSGWTVQRAMGLLWQRGRPAAVKLAVLIDRGHRAVPIRPNYVGKNVPTTRAERVLVRLDTEPPAPGRRSSDRAVVYSIVDPRKEPVTGNE